MAKTELNKFIIYVHVNDKLINFQIFNANYVDVLNFVIIKMIYHLIYCLMVAKYEI